jgi:hypothetical protein
MEKFFKENYRFPHLVFKDVGECEEEKEYAITIYDNSIGFCFGVLSDRYRFYMNCILCWMTQTVGRKHYFKRINLSLPYLINELLPGIIPVIQKEFKHLVPVTQKRYIIDRVGRIISSPAQKISKIDTIYIKHEIKRLDLLWKKENSTV